MGKVELEKLNLERDVERLKNKVASDETRINDYKSSITEMDGKLSDM